MLKDGNNLLPILMAKALSTQIHNLDIRDTYYLSSMPHD